METFTSAFSILGTLFICDFLSWTSSHSVTLSGDCSFFNYYNFVLRKRPTVKTEAFDETANQNRSIIPSTTKKTGYNSYAAFLLDVTVVKSMLREASLLSPLSDMNSKYGNGLLVNSLGLL